MARKKKEVKAVVEGPKDACVLETNCMEFDMAAEELEGRLHKAKVTASIEDGVFTIRDLFTDIMLAVNIEDAMTAIAETATKAKEDNDNEPNKPSEAL